MSKPRFKDELREERRKDPRLDFTIRYLDRMNSSQLLTAILLTLLGIVIGWLISGAPYWSVIVHFFFR